jgi:hypothetical protein
MKHDFFFSQTALAERYDVDPRTVLHWKKSPQAAAAGHADA